MAKSSAKTSSDGPVWTEFRMNLKCLVNDGTCSCCGHFYGPGNSKAGKRMIQFPVEEPDSFEETV